MSAREDQTNGGLVVRRRELESTGAGSKPTGRSERFSTRSWYSKLIGWEQNRFASAWSASVPEVDSETYSSAGSSAHEGGRQDRSYRPERSHLSASQRRALANATLHRGGSSEHGSAEAPDQFAQLHCAHASHASSPPRRHRAHSRSVRPDLLAHAGPSRDRRA
jgi:hypothetical protein